MANLVYKSGAVNVVTGLKKALLGAGVVLGLSVSALADDVDPPNTIVFLVDATKQMFTITVPNQTTINVNVAQNKDPSKYGLDTPLRFTLTGKDSKGTMHDVTVLVSMENLLTGGAGILSICQYSVHVDNTDIWYPLGCTDGAKP